jgi:hypothetical protein
MTHEVALETFLLHFNQAVAASTEKYPVTNVWRESNLIALISDIKATLKALGIQVTALPCNQDLLEQLERIGLVRELAIKEVGEGQRKPPRFFRIDIGASLFSEPVEMAEILQASLPEGVLCYSSAVRYYHLTTQSFLFQHVAAIVMGAAGAKRPPISQATARRQPLTPEDEIASGAETRVGRRDTLGTPSFTYAGVACYSLRRQAHTMPGTHQRILSPRARIRITTFEQTLLDTLYKPFYCGGPAIVFEAWQQHPEKLNQAKLARLVEKIGIDHWARRAGYMVETLGLAADPSWNALMEKILRRLDRSDAHNLLPLLPGMPYNSTSEKWMLLVP